jgi:alginate O-acetyltransferase complex protein AlgI
MIFTSYTYVAFLAVAFVLCWSLPTRWRNGLLTLLSYVFYASWKWPFVFLLLGVSLFTFYFARLMARRRDPGTLLMIGISIELLPLLYYKYLGFLLSNFSGALDLFEASWRPSIPSVFIPLGISFFTFQGIAYLVDVASGEPAFPRLSQFLLFKAFWPQLIAGPIIRPGEIRDQIVSDRKIAYRDVAEGLTRILQGFFKKVVLADSLAPIVDSVFLPGAAPAFTDAATGILGFGLQIYFDFSAYSDIAIGAARLFGFTFPENFDFPYAARSPQEFWNRWHMTLTRWIRDYVYTPLSFATRSRPQLTLLWLMLAMAICGLWHGAQWTFVIWGIWHGTLLLLNHTWLKPLFSAHMDRPGAWGVLHLLGVAVTFGLVMLGWVFFRANDLRQAGDMLSAILTVRGGWRPSVLRENAVLIVAVSLAGLLGLQFVQRPLQRVLAAMREGDGYAFAVVRGAFYAILIVLVIILDKEAKAFVYFQF